jgi:hypothetical protein
MTASKTIRAMLVHLRRTIEHTLRHVTVASVTLTISLPPPRRSRQLTHLCSPELTH